MNLVQDQDQRKKDIQVAIWLLIVCGLIYSMVILGGVTRLTNSGLSMVEWQPLKGVLPPMNQQEWTELFHKYQQFPEFYKLNQDMDVEGFKSIFWLEFLHRILGRVIGLVFLLPFLYFLFRGYTRKEHTKSYITMFALGACQGLLGWYMVKSGLIDNPHVSQYRLTAHLIAAFMIYGYIFWFALNLINPKPVVTGNDALPLKKFMFYVTAFITFTIMSGGLVAGLKAGFLFNTFPLMDGQFVPPDYLELSPVYLNFFENEAAVQFDHRLLAESLFCIIVFLWWRSRKCDLPRSTRIGFNLFLGMVILQVAMGISTLIFYVPTPLASAHQGGALILLTISLFLNNQLRGVGKERLS